MINSKFIITITILLAILPAVILLLVYNSLPEQVPMNYSFSGEVNSYGSKNEMWLFPGINIFLAILFYVLPKIDPKRNNYKKFGKFYVGTKLVTLLFFNIIFVLMVGIAIYPDMVKMNLFILVGVGLLFVFIGNYIPQAKQNFFVGIRTPWTLSSENVWIKTHRIGGYCFIISGLIIAICAFLPEVIGITLFIISVVIASFIPIVMSYIYYKKENKE